jgi:hypothetical protein
LHAAGWSHVKVVTRDHVDLDLPLAGDALAVGHDREYNGISATATHVNVDVLSAILAAKDWKAFANGGSNHEGIGRAKAILIGLGKGELLEVKTKLANIGLLFNGDLASVGSVLSSWI